jgi:hypothetical protein
MASPIRAYGNIANHHWSAFAGLRIVGDIVVWLVRVVMPTPQDLTEAGVHLAEMHD